MSADMAEASKFPGNKLSALDTAAKFMEPPMYEAANAETTYSKCSITSLKKAIFFDACIEFYSSSC